MLRSTTIKPAIALRPKTIVKPSFSKLQRSHNTTWAINNRPHVPVLLREVVHHLDVHESKAKTFVDCTFGTGGYTEAILRQDPEAKVIGIDRDISVAQKYATAIKEHYGENRFKFIHGTFGKMDSLLREQNISENSLGGIVFDLGVSSLQLDTPERGFSFRESHDGPLDMNMTTVPSETDVKMDTAKDVVNQFEERKLADIIWTYGEESNARRIAKSIVRYRKENEIETTQQLAQIIKDSIPLKERKRKKKLKKRDPATKTFQAIRIYLNDEMGELLRGLFVADKFLAPNGRLCVVSYHSLEDGLVKQFLKEKEMTQSLQRVNRKVIIPSEEELNLNPRSRSAKLRVSYKL
eukprot:gb/GECH01000829.1/.p1 GENE.gb/GECH01000829.1/~~gb/GECH01000829.1/.p1  ORF type:complete len:351 (+),score=69.91 gb/GECH01000829.1/:1-1053(+)